MIRNREHIFSALLGEYMEQVIIQDPIHARWKTTTDYMIEKVQIMAEKNDYFDIDFRHKENVTTVQQCFLDDSLSWIYFHAYYSRVNLAARTVVWKLCNVWIRKSYHKDLFETYTTAILQHVQRRHGIPSHLITPNMITSIIDGANTNLFEILQYSWEDVVDPGYGLDNEKFWRNIINKLPITSIVEVVRRSILIVREYKISIHVVLVKELSHFIAAHVCPDCMAPQLAVNLLLERFSTEVFPFLSLNEK
jgi:hypothetical protein